MKKFVVALLAAALGACLLAGCGGKEDVLDLSGDTSKPGNQTENTGDSQGTPGADGQTEGNNPQDADGQELPGYVFVYQDVKLYMGLDMKTVSDKLGEALEKNQEPSCKYPGEDIRYTYADFSVTANLDGDREVIYAIEFKSDLVETAEGVCIGADAAAVETAYGEPAEAGFYRYVKDGMSLSFIMENDEVTGISYIAD